jgi:protein-S-isoprenylcysteine O-methyltransferase Ste14
MVRRVERIFVWTGGALFVFALAYGAYSYFIVWASPEPGRSSSAAVDLALFALFAIHHTLFARERVKRWIAARIPPHLIRSIYVWAASLLFILVCEQWAPIGGELYRATDGAAIAHAAVQLAGVALMALSVRRIDALELAGIRQSSGTLQTTGPYGWVRHPVYLAWMLIVFGAAHMTTDRLTFAILTSLYLVIGVVFEERSLAREYPQAYDAYTHRVRSRIIPYVY